MRLVSVLAVLSLVSLGVPQSPKVPILIPKTNRPVAVIAHRGGMGEEAENTLAAVKNATAHGVDHVEVDVRQTYDGTIVAIHDEDLRRTTSGFGDVGKTTYEEIRKFKTANGEYVPTFREILELCRGKCGIYIHYKSGDARAIWQEVQFAKMAGSVVAYIPIEDAAYWHKIAPDLPLMVRLPTEYHVSGDIAGFVKKYPAVSILEGPFACYYSKELIAQAHRSGLKVFVDCLGSPELPEFLRYSLDCDHAYGQAIERGVDAIQTDYPQRLINYLNRNSSVVK